MDSSDVLVRFVPKFDTLFLSVKEADESTLTKTDHPLGWLLTVLQKEHANVEVISDALIEAMSHLNTLDEASAQQRRRAIFYLVLLILYRRPSEEHEELTHLVGRQVQQTSEREEIATMAQTMAEHLIEQGKAQGIEQGKIQGIEQGKVQGIEQGKVQEKQTAVLKLLRLRFDSVPESLINQITLIQSPAQLDSLFEKAFTSRTLDEVDLQNHDG